MEILNNSHISFVNLPHRVDRLSHIERELQRVGLRAVRTSGAYPHEFDEKDPRHQRMRRQTVGAIGCYTAQINIMKKALEFNKHAFIIEDDVVFCDDLLERIKYIENWADTHEFDVLWFGGTFHIGYKEGGPYWHPEIGRDAELTDDPRMIRTLGAFSTHAYIVHRNSLEKIIQQLEEWMSNSVGIDWSFIKMEPFLNTYSFIPGCAKQFDNESDQRPGSGDWTYFSKFEKLNGTIENSRYWWQPLMSDFDPTTFDWQEAQTKRWDWQK